MIPIYLHALAKRYPDVPAAVAELANLEAILALPAPTVHVVSDVHGEHVKLRQVIINASGSLRPLIERLLGDRLTDDERRDLLNLVYYPHETWIARTQGRDATTRRALVLWLLPHAVTVIRALSRRRHRPHRVRRGRPPAAAHRRRHRGGRRAPRGDRGAGAARAGVRNQRDPQRK